MKRLALALSLVLSAPAFAQQAQFNVGPNGFSMKVDAPPEGSNTATEQFRVTHEPSSGGRLLLKVLAPEGAACEIFDGARSLASEEIPLSVKVEPDKFYRVVVQLPGGGRFEKKIETRRRQITSVWVNAPAPAPTKVSRREEKTQVIENSAEGFRLVFRSHPEGRTLFKVLSPEGLHCQVYDGGRLVANDDVPLSFDADPDRFYRFVITAPSGAVWEKKFAARSGQEGSLYVQPPAGGPVAGPPGAPPVAAPAAMSSNDFSDLLKAIRKEGFPEDKMNVLTTAVPSAYFTIEQVGKLVDAFAFPNDKVHVVEVTRDRILDKNNAFKLFSHFTFPDDKEKVKQLLK
ncbi:MAG: DUF4476 domain-containing protein [Myxococcales bacterium]